MQSAKVNQTELAEQAGLSQSSVNRLKSSPHPSAAVIISIAERFQVRPAWLFNGSGPKYEANLTDGERELIELWRDPVMERLHDHFISAFRGIISDLPKRT